MIRGTATRAWCVGHDKARSKEASRLGSRAAEAHTDTWQTFAACYVEADGSGYVQVSRGATMRTITFGPEGKALRPVVS